MATATPNILIKSISGRIGNVVFYKRRGTQCVRTYVIPRNPDTQAQRAVRRAFSDAVRSWQSMSPDKKYAYTRKARCLNMSGYNLYISRYLKRAAQTTDLTSTHELKPKHSAFPWNLELSTWNYLSIPSVSPSYMRLSGPNACPESIKLHPG